MSAETKFVDTNGLVYLFDADTPHRQAREQKLLRNESVCLAVSVHVLGNFHVTVARKLAEPCC